MKKDLRTRGVSIACVGFALSLCLNPVEVRGGEIHALVRDKTGKGVVDAVVVAMPANRTAGAAGGATATIIVDQVNKEFVPYVLPVQVGTAVNFPNKDNIRHHVYSFSPARQFELRLYQGTPSEPVLFDKPGVVVLGCNIHDWMVGYVYVTDDPWFAVSDAQGRVQLDSVPAGSYSVSLWHPQAPNMLPQAAGALALGEQPSQQRFTLAMQTPAEVAPLAPSSSYGDAFKKATRDAAQ